jgi:hypothetical protein
MSTASASYNFGSELAHEEYGHAAPLMPLRTRDLQAMIELFQLKDIEAIERDILQNLVLSCPEPYWEDQVFGFLKEYLQTMIDIIKGGHGFPHPPLIHSSALY